jgi:hypothetical protein
MARLPASAIEYLREAIPRRGKGEEREYDYEAWLDEVFT